MSDSWSALGRVTALTTARRMENNTWEKELVVHSPVPKEGVVTGDDLKPPFPTQTQGAFPAGRARIKAERFIMSAAADKESFSSTSLVTPHSLVLPSMPHCTPRCPLIRLVAGTVRDFHSPLPRTEPPQKLSSLQLSVLTFSAVFPSTSSLYAAPHPRPYSSTLGKQKMAQVNFSYLPSLEFKVSSLFCPPLLPLTTTPQSHRELNYLPQ
ncbi:hypothetical protein Q8A73_022265 [Channa argus]|nr:hypothetical protein Q8A73_022265 [Channa argus]